MSLKNANQRAGTLSLATFALGSALQIGGYQNANVGWGLATLALLLGIYAFWDVEIGGRLFPLSYVSLRVAARRAYERSRGKIWGEVAEKFSDNPDEVLQYFATGLSGQIPIFGTHPPSTIREEVPIVEFASSGIEKGGTELRRHGEKLPHYIELEVRRRDLRDALRWFDEQNRGFDDLARQGQRGP